MKFDLHTHTNISDGKLSPSELIERAKQLHVDVLSITDHDSVAGYENLPVDSSDSIKLVAGIEFSSRWRNNNIHIIGLNIDLKNNDLLESINHQQKVRIERAEIIIEKLSKKLKTEISFKEIIKSAHNNNVGRPHIAEYLVKNNLSKDVKHAFEKYLGSGKMGDLKTNWLDMQTIINVILSSGGIAVIAHPGKYKFTRTKLLELVDDFRNCGGQAMEVISGKQPTQLTGNLVKIAELKDLYSSCGSDFHQPGQSWTELGQFESLPKNCKAIWELF